MRARLAIPILITLPAWGCAEPPRVEEDSRTPSNPEAARLPEGAEAFSLLGDTLYAPELPEAMASDRMARYD
jgi:hypothetical protein